MTTMAPITSATSPLPGGVQIDVSTGDRFTPSLIQNLDDVGKTWEVLVTNKALSASLSFQVCQRRRDVGKPTGTQICAALLGDIELSALPIDDLVARLGCSQDQATLYHQMLVGRASSACRLGLAPTPAWLRPAKRPVAIPEAAAQPEPVAPPKPIAPVKQTRKASPAPARPQPPPPPPPPTGAVLSGVLDL